jgi:hypothetical protein
MKVADKKYYVKANFLIDHGYVLDFTLEELVEKLKLKEKDK